MKTDTGVDVTLESVLRERAVKRGEGSARFRELSAVGGRGGDGRGEGEMANTIAFVSPAHVSTNARNNTPKRF